MLEPSLRRTVSCALLGAVVGAVAGATLAGAWALTPSARRDAEKTPTALRVGEFLSVAPARLSDNAATAVTGHGERTGHNNDMHSARPLDEPTASLRLIGEPTWLPRPVFSMSFEESPRRSRLTTGSIAVIEGRWKLIHYMGALHYPMMPPLHDELYDLSSDPDERRNLAAADPQEVKHLLGLIDAQLALHGGPLH